MTYDELFQLKGLEKAKLLAGKSILGREISGPPEPPLQGKVASRKR